MGIIKPKVGIISYCDKVRTYASVNHQYYANRHNYTYIYDIAPTKERVFKNKIEKILKYLDLFDWILWIDDDAFFINTDKKITDFINANRKCNFVFCNSPVVNGNWTYLNSGVFFVKNTQQSKDFLRAALSLDLDAVKQSWDGSRYGLFTNGDQDIITHLLHNDRRFNRARFHTVLDYTNFNSRPNHFTTDSSSDQHFIAHFAGHKKEDVFMLASDLNLSPALIRHDSFAEFNGVYEP